MTTADRVLVVALAAALLLMLGLALAPSGSGGPSGPALAGEPRNLDVDLLRRKILAGDLSDEEALFYHPER